ncbi:AAA family ATPase [Streptomyces scabiei]|uniref:AAA family ATPase n=1 Tax=Streptomyces scabiei TaxID=1930 RepID=UPI0033EC4663
MSADVGKYVGDGLYDEERAIDELFEAARSACLGPDDYPDSDESILRLVQRGLDHGISQGLDDATLIGLGVFPNPEDVPTTVQKDQDPTTRSVTYKGSNGRTAVLTPMSSVKMKRAKWVWKDRISMGTLAILAGQPSMGKSQTSVWIAARLTRGELYGEFYGTPKDVIICATEDSFEYTIKPRLMAAGADPSRVYRVDIVSRNDILDGLNLIEDRELLRAAVQDLDVALLILDPLMSRLGGKIDSHKDAEVRLALEPLVALAHECDFAVIGLMHFNKSGNTNPMNSLMGSVAFGAVARSVHICAPDSEDPTRRIFGTEKNNLGKTSGPSEHDLDTWRYYIKGVQMPTEDDDKELLTTSRIVWDGDSQNTVADSLAAMAKQEKSKTSNGTKLDDAKDWLMLIFEREGNALPKAKVMEIAELDKFSKHAAATLRRAIADTDLFGTLQSAVDGKRVAYWGLKEDIEELQRGLN